MLRIVSANRLAALLMSWDRNGGPSGPFAGRRRARFYRRLAQTDLAEFLATVDKDLVDPPAPVSLPAHASVRPQTVVNTRSRVAA